MHNLSLNPTQNNSGFVSERYSTPIDTALAKPNEDKRTAIYSQLNDILIDEAFCFTTATVPIRIAARANVRDIAINAHDSFNYKTAVSIEPRDQVGDGRDTA